MDALLAALDDSPDALLRVRTLLQQDGTLANGLDGSGTSALMHASAAGLSECCAALLATNPKAPRRWPQLLSIDVLQQRCPTASFTVPDATFPERFLSAPPLRTCAVAAH